MSNSAVGDAVGNLEHLRQRGLVAQCTNERQISRAVAEGALTFYVGVDPTAPSLHLGHLVPLMLLYWLAKAGNRALIVIGDGTARIGDPSGREEARELMDDQRIADNAARIHAQLESLASRMEVEITVIYNSRWLSGLRYLDFLRDIGRHFSVNRMLSFESYRRRMERGLSFIEFNYQLLQSYDFLQLYQHHKCHLQIGGDDQWGNIVAGIDLIRRLHRHESYAITTPLVTNARGEKMGKSVAGALYLDAEITPPYELYQYWRNIDDRDLPLSLLRYTTLDGALLAESADHPPKINELKARVAFEIVQLAHGKQRAQQCHASAQALFSGGTPTRTPGSTLPLSRLNEGIGVIDLFMQTPFMNSRSEVRRLIAQGGATVNGEIIRDPEKVFDLSLRTDHHKNAPLEPLELKVGKKRHWSISFTD